jgi:hypothetical protein
VAENSGERLAVWAAWFSTHRSQAGPCPDVPAPDMKVRAAHGRGQPGTRGRSPRSRTLQRLDGQARSDRAFRPHVFTLRSEHLVWLGAGHTRGHGALDLFGLFERYTGTLVSDDCNGYSKYQAILTAR